ncbi:unnamed protein product [Withania somnifera]
MRRSLRMNSNSFWRNDNNVFNSSSRDEDDEEALKWAALEKLPTFDRLRKGLLFGTQGGANEVDIHHLGNQQIGLDLPSIEVRYEHLNIEVDAYTGSRALPTFTNFMTNLLEPCRMTLLLGPPGSGKSTLLLALAGKLDPAFKVQHDLSYIY